MSNYEISVVRCNRNDTDDVTYIGRGSPFGNPFPVTVYHSRDKVCDMYENYFNEQVTTNYTFFSELKRLHEKGKRKGYLNLGCFCNPYRCHGDTIKNYLDKNRDLFENYT